VLVLLMGARSCCGDGLRWYDIHTYIYIQSFIKIGSRDRKLMGKTHIHSKAIIKSLYLSLQNEENMLKTTVASATYCQSVNIVENT
jgi:hypothetical protein